MSNSDTGSHLDRTDYRILAELAANARLPVTELAARVGLSKSPCQVRLKRLQEKGVIRGFRTVIDPAKLGLDHVAFVEVRLTDTTERSIAAFNAAVRLITEVEQCHLIAGSFDYLLKVRTRDIRTYRDVLGTKISALPHVAGTSTYVSMQPIIDDSM